MGETLEREARRLAMEYRSDAEIAWAQSWYEPGEGHWREMALRADQTARVLEMLAEKVEWYEAGELVARDNEAWQEV